MTEPNLLIAAILGVVEGLTEFLPVSSTGHLIVAGSLLGYTGERAKFFEIVIQAGAILAVCWEFRARLIAVAAGVFSERAAQRFVFNLFIAFLPAAVLGLAFGKAIKASLFAPVPVATAFIVGAFVILWAERRQRRNPALVRIESIDDLRWTDALKIGCAQALALIPGTSRSGATIIGGMLFGLSRKAATEFSFFLAIPT
ncbi:MAG TPA: undecaprenyl-diphosphate phosphatase, partial [Casimicrobiaceae bacterium]